MITSSPWRQSTGVATWCFAVNCSESITGRISEKSQPVAGGPCRRRAGKPPEIEKVPVLAKTTEVKWLPEGGICIRPATPLLFEVMLARDLLLPKIAKFARPQQR
jgi:hypothetical protein